MKRNHRLPTLFVILASVSAFALSSCAGIQVRDDVLMPVAAKVYERVRANIDRGIEVASLSPSEAATATATADRLGSILDSGDRAEIASIPWETLESYARLGIMDMIEAGDITIGVADFLLQRLMNFREQMAQLSVRISPTPPPR